MVAWLGLGALAPVETRVTPRPWWLAPAGGPTFRPKRAGVDQLPLAGTGFPSASDAGFSTVWGSLLSHKNELFFPREVSSARVMSQDPE